jgi:2-phosphosulfolactate phosphatase
MISQMEFRRVSLDECETVTGTVIVIDVLRAFSTAAYAFAAGAHSIALVSSVDEALAFKKQNPEALLMGEVDGLPIAGFDFSNSPISFEQVDLKGRFMIQRTSAGTQGVIRCRRATTLLASSFCCAVATVRYVQRQAPIQVTFVVTGWGKDGHGDEDMACADYLEALLRGEMPETVPFLQRVYASPAGRVFAGPARPEFSEADLKYCTQVDRFDFAMLVQQCDGVLLMQMVR